ncbi:uncharacterized protein LOC117195334 [Drosophila miranda]|uniref:uncharacterized protein LOC117195334 n=1 Tax=Drosophila miranda TaxID=7229 RepID=UPI00143F5BDE|nr:uncharacterized protein LOC117195334 [Drosophila miranda]
MAVAASGSTIGHINRRRPIACFRVRWRFGPSTLGPVHRMDRGRSIGRRRHRLIQTRRSQCRTLNPIWLLLYWRRLMVLAEGQELLLLLVGVGAWLLCPCHLLQPICCRF